MPVRLPAEVSDTVHHWKVEGSIMPGKAITIDQWQRRWMKDNNNFAIDAKIGYRYLPHDSCTIAKDYHYPTLSFGVRWQMNHGITMHKKADTAWPYIEEADFDSEMGNIITGYGQFERPLFTSAKWDVGYDLSVGVGYSKRKYNKTYNIDNEIIGSRWNIFFGAGIYARYLTGKDWGLKGGIQFYHHSNGAMNRPNKGANIVSPYMGLFYLFDRTRSDNDASKHDCSVSTEKWVTSPLYLQCSGSIGFRTLLEEWTQTQYHTKPNEPDYRTTEFKEYIGYSLQMNLMYRYARRWASGIGFDLFYGDYYKRVEEVNKINGYNDKLSPWSFGISLSHEVFYHRLSLAMSLGYYIYRNMGEMARLQEKPYYEKIGVFYRIPKLGIKVGGQVKAHLTKADLTEITISLPLYIHSSFLSWK